MNRDVWDLDWAFEQSLVTLPVNGKPTKLVVTGGKSAIFDAVNRVDGKYEFSKDLGLQNVVASIDPKTGKKIINPALEPQPGRTDIICPHPTGARNWPTTAIRPDVRLSLRAASRQQLHGLQLGRTRRRARSPPAAWTCACGRARNPATTAISAASKPSTSRPGKSSGRSANARRSRAHCWHRPAAWYSAARAIASSAPMTRPTARCYGRWS